MIAGGALFSALIFHEWALSVFRSRLRATAFALLVETTMLLASTRLLSIIALLPPIVIN
jgi:hypothetical protein